MSFRVGQGYDVHAFDDHGDTVILGGVPIPHTRALKAHSDGDVLLHAICDALLGACALGDIGQHFPDQDEQYRGASSRDLLRSVLAKVRQAGYALVNVDSTIVAQKPRMAAHIPAMRSNLAEDTGLPLDALSVKATTTERLGFAGREEGIACYAVVLLNGAS